MEMRTARNFSSLIDVIARFLLSKYRIFLATCDHQLKRRKIRLTAHRTSLGVGLLKFVH